MALTRYEGRDICYGLSSDTKPTDYPYESMFIETDTNLMFKYTPAGWLLAGNIAGEANDGCTSVYADSGANAAQTITVAAVAAKNHYLDAFGVSVGGAALASTVTITILDDATVIYKTTIGVGAPIGEARYREFPKPIKITTNKALKLTITAGGAAVVTTGCLVYRTR